MAEMHEPLRPSEQAISAWQMELEPPIRGPDFNRTTRRRSGLATFKAIRIDKAEKGTTAALAQFDEAELMDGDVTVAVEWSTVNYKDGLAITGKSPVVRRFPMIAGVDFAGTVLESSHAGWKPGDKVVSTGWGLGENAPRRLCREGARERRLAGALAGRHDHSRSDGDRHGGLYRNAVGCWRWRSTA